MTRLIERQEEKQLPKKLTKADVAKKIAEEYEKDHEMVSGVFRNLEHKGGTLNFRFKKYKQDNYDEYSLVDGQRYTLPRMVVKHLNNNVHYMKYSRVKDGVPGSLIAAANNDGRIKTNDKMHAIEKDRRCEFIPVDFNQDNTDLMPNDIVQVSYRY